MASPEPLPKGMAHVSRYALYTQLSARVDYLKTFLEFDSADVAALIDGRKYIHALIPAIVNMVYKKLLRHDITARVFSTRDSRVEDNPDIDSWVTEESSQIRNRKMFLRWYLTRLNGDVTQMGYWEYLDKVGLMHVGRGRPNPLHVDYIFLGACLGYIQDSMTEAILSHPRLELERKIAIVKAIGKVIWIQNDLLARWHIDDGREFDNLESKLALEPEGYPRGNQAAVNGDDSSSGRADSISSRKSTTSLGRTKEEVRAGNDVMKCPFSGIARETMESQRAATWRPRTRDSKYIPDTPSGMPRLHVVDGKTVCKENLAPNPFDD